MTYAQLCCSINMSPKVLKSMQYSIVKCSSLGSRGSAASTNSPFPLGREPFYEDGKRCKKLKFPYSCLLFFLEGFGELAKLTRALLWWQLNALQPFVGTSKTGIRDRGNVR